MYLKQQFIILSPVEAIIYHHVLCFLNGILAFPTPDVSFNKFMVLFPVITILVEVGFASRLIYTHTTRCYHWRSSFCSEYFTRYWPISAVMANKGFSFFCCTGCIKIHIKIQNLQKRKNLAEWWFYEKYQ